MTRTLVLEHDRSIFFTAPAHVAAGPELDHASGWDVPTETSPYIRWIAGDFVESGNPNSNGQYWTADDLALGEYSITYSPLNLLHRFKIPVGFFHSTRRAPTKNVTSQESVTAAAESEFRIQFLAGMWTHIFPEEFAVVRSASDDNRLFASMECVGSRLHCMGDNGCDKQFEYFAVDTHCAHLKEHKSVRHIVDPVFRGGGLIVPPVRPGWKQAHASVLDDELMSMIAGAESAQEVYQDWNRGGYDLSVSDWETLMGQVVASGQER